MRRRPMANIGAQHALKHAAIPIARHVQLQRRNDQSLGPHIRRQRMQARRAAAKVQMMRHRSGKAEQLPRHENRMKEKHILQMLAAGIGIVDREEIPLDQVLQRIDRGAGLKNIADSA
jgi:hypothetical protein